MPVNCSICLEQFTEDARYTSLQCSHTFHKDCIDKWLENNETCPICRDVCVDVDVIRQVDEIANRMHEVQEMARAVNEDLRIHLAAIEQRPEITQAINEAAMEQPPQIQWLRASFLKLALMFISLVIHSVGFGLELDASNSLLAGAHAGMMVLSMEFPLQNRNRWLHVAYILSNTMVLIIGYLSLQGDPTKGSEVILNMSLSFALFRYTTAVVAVFMAYCDGISPLR